MRILYFSHSHTPHDHRFLTAIAEAGHEAFFLRTHQSSSEVRALPSGVSDVTGSLDSVSRTVKPDLVHAGPLHEAAYLAAGSGARPLVAMSWGSDLLWQARRNPLARRRVRHTLNRADALIGDCLAVSKAAQALGMPAERIVTFPWGVDLQHFKPGRNTELLKKLGWQNHFVVLHLRSMEPLYDPLTTVKAFLIAARKNARLRLLMPGSGNLAPKVTRLLAQTGLQDHVYLPGNIAHDDLPSYYNAADLYVSSSLSDGSSVSLMEALASGLPAAVTDIPSNREWVQIDQQGWLFASKDASALAEVILQAAEKNLDEHGRSARLTAEAKADWSVNKRGLFKAYDRAMEHAG